MGNGRTKERVLCVMVTVCVHMIQEWELQKPIFFVSVIVMNVHCTKQFLLTTLRNRRILLLVLVIMVSLCGTYYVHTI